MTTKLTRRGSQRRGRVLIATGRHCPGVAALIVGRVEKRDMGLSLEFYAGDADKIGQAFSGVEFEGLRNGTLAHSYADLSLHISPTDLDILSEQAAGLLGRPPVLLLDSLERNVGGTPDESSADVVSRVWTEFMAAVPAGSAAQLSSIWLSAVIAESGEEIEVGNPEAAHAVGDLLTLCREALARRTDVVFAWYL